MTTTTPAFQFYVNDWLSSTKISTMTPAEEGAYIRLLCYCWNDPDCTLPDDDNLLAVLSRLGDGWLKGSSEKLRLCFTPHPKKPGRLVNVRLLEERKKQAAWRKKSREGGRQSAKIRANTRDLQEQSGGSSVQGWLNGGSPMVETKDEPKGNSSVFPLRSSSPPPLPKDKDTHMCNGHSGQVWEKDFERFWAAYPRKQHRGDAEEWFRKNRPTPELVDQMLAKISEFKTTDAWQENKGQFVPLPFNWLDAKCWKDIVRVDVPRKPRVLVT